MKKSAEGRLLNEAGTNYDKDAYEKAANTTDIGICRIHNHQLKILLIKRKHPPFRGSWALPGGFIDIAKKEGIDECAYREAEEEVHVKSIPIRQLKTYGDPDRDPRMRIITTVYYTLVSEEKIKTQKISAGSDAKEAKWFNIRRLPKISFDHKKIIKDLLNKLKVEIIRTPIAFELVKKEFIWNELQEVYEVILGKKLITPNFRRKINRLYKIEKIDKTKPILPKGRPASFLKYKGEHTIFD